MPTPLSQNMLAGSNCARFSISTFAAAYNWCADTVLRLRATKSWLTLVQQTTAFATTPLPLTSQQLASRAIG